MMGDIVKKIWIITILLACVSIVAFIIPKNEYVGTWTNVVVHESLTVKTVVKIKNNGRVKIVKTSSDESGTYIKEGSWKVADSELLFEFKEWDSTLTMHFIKIEKDTMCLDYSYDCPEWQYYHKDSLFSSSKSIVK